MQLQNKKIKIEFLSKDNLDEYNQFVLNRGDSTIYHTSEWKEVLERVGYRTYFLIAKDDENNICASLPLSVVHSIYGKRLDSIPNSCYGGIIGDRLYIKPLIKTAIELKKKLGCRFLIIKDNLTKYDKLFMDLGMKNYNKWWCQVTKIKSPFFMWKTIKKTNRTNIRKAIKCNVYIKRVTKEEELKEFYKLYAVNNRYLGFAPFSYSYFLFLWRILKPKGYIEVFFAKHNDQVIASSCNFPFNRTVYSAFSGWDITKKSFKPNNFLDWYLLTWCYKKGYEYFDFGLTVKENKGLFSYKSSFNTINTAYAIFFSPADIYYFKKQDFLTNLGGYFVRNTPCIISKKVGMFLNKYFV